MASKKWYLRRLEHLLLFVLMVAPIITMAQDKITFLGVSDDEAFIQVGEQAETLKKNQEASNGMRLLKANPRYLCIDLNNRLYSVEQAKLLYLQVEANGENSNKTYKTVEIDSDEKGMYRVYGKINDKDVIFLVDSGASHVAMNSEQAKRLGLDYKNKGVITRVATGSGRAKAYALRLDSVNVNDIKAENVAALILEGKYPKDVLLGMSFFKNVELIHRDKKLILKQK